MTANTTTTGHSATRFSADIENSNALRRDPDLAPVDAGPGNPSFVPEPKPRRGQHTQPISAPVNRAVTVEVYEPRQHQEQEEVILDRFNLFAGEVVDYPLRSNTAAYRFHDLTDPEELERLERRRRDDPSEPTPSQRPRAGYPPLPDTDAELSAGADRQQELEQAEQKAERAETRREKTHAKAQVAGGVSTPSSGPAEHREAEAVKVSDAAPKAKTPAKATSKGKSRGKGKGKG